MDKKYTRRTFLTQLGIAGVTASVAVKKNAQIETIPAPRSLIA